MAAYPFAVILGLLVVLVVSEWHHRRVERDLINRLMARDYAQYKYYEDKWQGDLKEIEKVREDTREETKQEAAATPESPAVDLSKFDEAWEDEENQ